MKHNKNINVEYASAKMYHHAHAHTNTHTHIHTHTAKRENINPEAVWQQHQQQPPHKTAHRESQEKPIKILMTTTMKVQKEQLLTVTSLHQYKMHVLNDQRKRRGREVKKKNSATAE